MTNDRCPECARLAGEDKVLLEFTVLWEGWELDSKAWVMERPNGTRYLKITSHGAPCEASKADLEERIAEYEAVLAKSREALALLTPNEHDATR